MASEIFGDSLSSLNEVAYSTYPPDELSKLLEANQTLAVSIESLEVQGAGRRVRPSFLQAQVDPIINSTKPLTLPQLLTEFQKTSDRLKRYGIYSDARFTLDLATITPLEALSSSSDVHSELYSGIKPLDLKATLFLTRANPHPFHIHTAVHDDGPASITVSGALKNLFGGAESLSIAVSKESNPTETLSYAADFSVPTCIKSPDSRLHLTGVSLANATILPSQSYKTSLLGGSLKFVKNSSVNPASFVEIGASAYRRGLNISSENDSSTISSTPTESTKTSLFSRFVLDTRVSTPESPSFVHNGYVLDWQTELAGVLGPNSKYNGDVSFLKSQAQAQFTRSLDNITDNVVFNLTAGTGFLWAYNKPGVQSGTTIYDRFFLGGKFSAGASTIPLLLYGFQPNGLGPKDGSEPVGGDVYAAVSVSTLVKFPKFTFVPKSLYTQYLSPLRVIGYFSQANLTSLKSSPSDEKPLSESRSSSSSSMSSYSNLGEALDGTYKDVFRNPATCAGLGLVYKTPVAQFELIYSTPIIVPGNATDFVKKGWQLGVGFDVDY